MKGIVTNVCNFLDDENWLFIIKDSDKLKYYVMAAPFYKENKLKSPVTKRELDSLNELMQVDFEYIRIGEKNIVTRLKW